jgi:3-deoxy-D-manno-octulosonate 8-phosphate phosphatase (KDO 8-P phosphatase)
MKKKLSDLRFVKLAIFDFDGVFTDNCVYVNQDGVESVRCWRSDGLGIANLLSAGVEILILSTETNPVVTARANKLKIACMQGVQDKANAIFSLSKELNINLNEIVYVGNDSNDICALKIVGFPIAVSDANPDIRKHVFYTTKKAGGLGAVREVCDLIFDAKSQKA